MRAKLRIHPAYCNGAVPENALNREMKWYFLRPTKVPPDGIFQYHLAAANNTK